MVLKTSPDTAGCTHDCRADELDKSLHIFLEKNRLGLAFGVLPLGFEALGQGRRGKARKRAATLHRYSLARRGRSDRNNSTRNFA